MSSTSHLSASQASASAAVSPVWATWWRGWLKPARVLVLPGSGQVPGDDAGLATVASDLPVPAFDAALLAWRDWCRAHAGQRCKLALSSAWTLTGLAPLPSDTSASMTAEQAVDHMARQWDHYLGVGGAVLARDWVVRTTRVPGGWLVCATPRQLVQDLLTIAHGHRVRVVWMGPWWTRGLQRWARQARASTVQIQEPGWCLHAVMDTSGASRPRWVSVWSEPLAEEVAMSGAVGDARALPHTAAMCVRLSRHGAASAACVWDDAATQDLIDGVPAAWSARKSSGGAP